MSQRNPYLQSLIDRAERATYGRRVFVQRGAIGGAAAASALIACRSFAGAQDATAPASPAAAIDLSSSISREEFYTRLNEVFPINPDAPQGGTIIIGDSTDITTTNGILSDNQPTGSIIGLVFETLVGSDPTAPNYVPGLADSWELADDGITYTFNINQNALWHDGTPVTADDAIFSFDAQSNEETTSSYTGTFVATIASYEKIDDHTVRVVATEPYNPLVFFGNFYCPIMPRHIWESVPPGEWRADAGSTGQDPARVIGTGPFKFVSWTQGESVELVRNEEYYDEQAIPNIESLTFVVWPDDAAAVEALRAGGIDIFEQVPAADTQALADLDDIDVALYDTFSFGFYGYNMDPEKTPLFQDVEVRQALFYALDRQSIVDNIQLGYGEVAIGTHPVLSPAYAPNEINTIYNFDVARATELLDSAGWVAGDDGIREKDGNRLAFELMYGAGSAATDQQVAYMQEAWAAVGAEMTPNSVDFSTVVIPAITETFDYQIALLGFNWDVTGDQTAMFSSSSYGAGFNFMRYSNPEVDRLNLEASVELDAEVRRQLLIDAANLVNDELPVGIINFRENRDGYNVRVNNFNPNAYAGFTWSMPFVWIED